MSSINRINVNQTNSSQPVGVGISGGAYTNGISYRESFDFKEIILPEKNNKGILAEEREFFWQLFHLFMEIVESGVIIKPRHSRDYGSYIVEASYLPPQGKNKNHIIYAPLLGVVEELKAKISLMMQQNLIKNKVHDYVARIIQSSSDTDILRLLIVISHEFGHFISNVRGNHNSDLKIGIDLLRSGMASRDVTKVTWNVFREECSAWSYGKDILNKYKFSYWQEFDHVKYESLKVYFRQLKLLESDLSTYIKLSMLGDDFKYSSEPVFFQNHK